MKPNSLIRAVARQRRDQADVRAFRRLDRADAAVVRRVHVAHLEPGALARQPAGPEGREAPLVRDLRERVGLVHELRQLRRPEELANRGHDRLRVDQVVRHGGRHFLVDRHLLLDRALHADQPDAELVLEQLADRADAPVAQVVDVVHRRRVPPQLEQELDDLVEVLRVQDLLVERRVQPELGVQLEAADPREVVLLRVEEHVLEQRPRAVLGRRVAGPQAAVDLDQRLDVVLDRVLPQRLRHDRADLVALREEDVDALDALLLEDRDLARGQLLVRLDEHLAGRRSTTSCAANAPSSSASSIRTASTPAFRRAAIAEFVIFLPLWMTMSEPLISMSSPARRPTRLSLTVQNTLGRQVQPVDARRTSG